MTLIKIPTLRTPRLVLRAMCADDQAPFAAMNANPEVMRYLGSGKTRTEAETWDMMARMLGQWGLRGYGMFALEYSGRFIGRSGILHALDWPEPELAYGVDQPYWGQGLATESAIAIRDWAFSNLDLPLLASFVRPDNAGSIGVLRKLGAVRTNTLTLLGGPAERWEHRPDGAGGGRAV